MHFRSKHADFGAKLTFFLIVAGVVLIAFIAGGVDFRSYYGAAVLVTRGGNPYDYNQLAPVLVEITGYAGNSPYFYPPWFTLLLLPFTLLPFQIARLVWLILNAALFCAALPLLQEALGWDVDGWRKYTAYLIVTLNFAAYCLRSEQVGIILFFALVLALVAIQRGRYALAGLALVILLTKPQVTLPAAGVIALWMLIKQRRSLFWPAGWIAALTLLSSVLIPKWWQFDRRTFGVGLAYAQDGPDQIVAERVLSTIYDFSDFILGIGPPFHYLLAAILAMAGMALVVMAWRQNKDLPTIIAAILILTCLVTPYTLQYDYVLLVLPFSWILMRLHSLEKTSLLATICLLAFSFSVLIWQEWAYEGYLQLLALAGAFALTLYDVGRRPAIWVQIPESRTLEA